MDDVARYYTRGVRFPRLVGKTHDGTRIPGGPYTITQVTGGLVVFVAAQILQPLWGGHGLVVDYAVLLSSVAVAVFALKFVRPGGRDPFTAGLALLGVYTQPRTGRVGGRPVRVTRPGQVRGRIALLAAPITPPAPEPARQQVVHAPARPPAPTAAPLRGLAGLAGDGVTTLAVLGPGEHTEVPAVTGRGRTPQVSGRPAPGGLAGRPGPVAAPGPTAVGRALAAAAATRPTGGQAADATRRD